MFFTAIHQMMTESVDLTIVIRKTNDRHPQDKRTTDRFHITKIERTQGRGPEPHRAADRHGHTAGTRHGIPAGHSKTDTEDMRTPLQHGTVRGTGGKGRSQQQGRQGSEIQGDEGGARKTREVRETDEEGQ